MSLALHAMENIDPDFVKKVKSGDVIVARNDFGCGSSREHAVWALRGAGVACVIAESFARIFYRNAVNNGFPAAECRGITEGVENGAAFRWIRENGVERAQGFYFGEPLPSENFAIWLREFTGGSTVETRTLKLSEPIG